MRREAQTKSLERALEGGSLESPEFAAALEAAEALSQKAERLLKDVLGMSDEAFAARANRVARSYQERGLLPEGVEPVARGYFPHREEGEDVVDPGRVLGNLVRQLLRYETAVKGQRWLYEGGRPMREGEPVPKGMMLMRNPDVSRTDVPESVLAAIMDPKYADLTGRAGGFPNPETFLAWVDTWLYRGGLPKPVWVDDVANVRMQPKGIVKTMLPEVFAAATPRGRFMRWVFGGPSLF